MQIADKYAPQEIRAARVRPPGTARAVPLEPDAREPYTVVIPPPNVTGMLHMGHMLNNTVAGRPRSAAPACRERTPAGCRARTMRAIATEAKVVARAEAEARHREVRRSPARSSSAMRVGLEGAVRRRHPAAAAHVWALRATGTAPVSRWTTIRTEGRHQGLLSTSTSKGRIYRGVRMVNWDPAGQDRAVGRRGGLSRSRTASSTTCAMRSRGRTNTSSWPRRAPRPSWAIRRCASIPTTPALRVAAAGRPRGRAARRALDSGDPRRRMSTSPSVRVP